MTSAKLRNFVVLVGAAAVGVRATSRFLRASRKGAELRARRDAEEDLARARREAGLSADEVDLYSTLQSDPRFSRQAASEAFAHLGQKEPA